MAHLQSKLTPRSEDFRANVAAMQLLVADLNRQLLRIAVVDHRDQGRHDPEFGQTRPVMRGQTRRGRQPARVHRHQQPFGQRQEGPLRSIAHHRIARNLYKEGKRT